MRFLFSGMSRMCLHCGKQLILCGCEDVDHGYDALIIPELVPPPLPTMYPADSIKRSILLYDITAGQRSVRDLQPVLDDKDVVVALLQQHKAGFLQAIQAINSSEDLEQLLFEAYTDETSADTEKTVTVVRLFLLSLYDVADAESARVWLSATVKLFCSCCFTKLASLHLYALHGLAKRVVDMSANHLLAMQDLINYLYLGNASLFDRNCHSIEMEEDQIMLIKDIKLANLGRA